MTNSRSDRSRWLRVVCERCMIDHAAECEFCGGKRYFYWDPVTCFCYTPAYQPVIAIDDNGDPRQVIRRHPKTDRETPASQVMLEYLGEWVKEDAKRRFKLWYENGWNCYAWPNRYKPGVIESSHPDLTECIRQCYLKVQDLNGSRTRRSS